MRKFIGSILCTWILTISSIGISFAQQDIDNCFTYKKAADYKRATEAGKRAIKFYPKNLLAHYCLGDVYRLSGELNLALSEMKAAERLANSKNDLMIIYNRVGLIFDDKGDFDNALLYYNRALSLAKEVNDKDLESALLNNIATIFKEKGDIDKALNYYEDALNLSQEKNKPATLNNIALIYNQKGEYQKGISYLKKAIEINERYGDYHGIAICMINIGDTYRSGKDYVKAEEYLGEGLQRIIKIGDKVWEATSYKYIGWLYKDKGEIKKAKDFLTKAYNLYESIGAKESAQDALFSLLNVESQKTKKLYAGIEIGAKGVKAMVIDLSPTDKPGFYNIKEKMRRTINTGIISGVAQTGLFTDDAIIDTAQAVKELFYNIKTKYNIPESDIFIAGSSAITPVGNKDKLAQKIKELTGNEMGFIDKDYEVFYNIIGSIPEKIRTSALSLDIGSGNTKIGYMEESNDSTRTVAIEIPFGTVTFSDLIKRGSTTDKEFTSKADKLTKNQISQKFKQEISRKPAIKNRNPVFMVGGIIWAMSTLLYPENQDSFIKITETDISRFYEMLSKNPKAILNPNLSKIKDSEIKEDALKQIQSVKDTFSTENLIAGAKILKMLSDELNLKDRELYFSRYGSWIWGYTAVAAIDTEEEKKNIPKQPVKPLSF